MKFKVKYFYGLLALAAITVLIIVATQENSNSDNPAVTNDQIMPDDDVHKQLMKEGNGSPSKENVSEEYKKKLSKLKAAVDKNPNDTLAMKNYADYLMASHQMNEAISYYEKILKVNPRRTDIYFSLAIIYYNKQDFMKCEEVNNKVLSYDSINQMALYNLGAIAATTGNLEKARDFWKKVISIDADSKTGELAEESLTKLN